MNKSSQLLREVLCWALTILCFQALQQLLHEVTGLRGELYESHHYDPRLQLRSPGHTWVELVHVSKPAVGIRSFVGLCPLCPGVI